LRGKAEEQQAVYRNRQRVRSHYGKSLLRRRGELVERSFAHCYETGNMRRTHLRKHENIHKRQLIHVGAFNLSLILCKMVGAGTPRELSNRLAGPVIRFFSRIWTRIEQRWACSSRIPRQPEVFTPTQQHCNRHLRCRNYAASTTGC
jgi:hypothetical protein